MNQVTLEDIHELIEDLEKSDLIKLKEVLLWIPFIGRNLYEKAEFQETKIAVLRTMMEKVSNSTLDEQELIEEFTVMILEHRTKKRS